MKKTVLSISAFLLCLAASAQGDAGFAQQLNMEVFRAIAIIVTLVIFMVFIFSMLKLILDNRLKNRIVDRGIGEEMANSLLQTKGVDNRQQVIKWFALLAGVGAGFTVINYTQPVGYHSLAIMAFSISISFLGYYFFLKQSEK
ncbi:MAG: hypothetical protein GXC78_20275 [Chitinophagaceae bacterium]|nr:hypothetical protein [Chitinophagaceae bacterium]